MLKLIKNILLKFIDDIDTGNCNMYYEEQCKVLQYLGNIYNGDERFSKIQAAEYLGVCRSTFDNYVKDGFIPKGIKQEGFKELYWYKSDLDVYKDKLELDK